MEKDTSEMTPNKKEYWKKGQRAIMDRQGSGVGGGSHEDHDGRYYPHDHHDWFTPPR